MGNSNFVDGLKSFVSNLANSRTATTENYIEAQRLNDVEARNIYRTGLGSKIIRIKAGYSLKDTLQFESTADQEFFDKRLKRLVKQVVKWQIAFGRGIVVLHHRGDDLSAPLGKVDPDRILLNVFSGDMTTVNAPDRNLQSPRYYKPVQYNVRGTPIHYSRVVDFLYVLPPELDAPQYRYGGIGEFELIYEQLINDGVVQRAVPRIIEKGAGLFYKVKGFKDAMRTGKESEMVQYFNRLEKVRGLFAAGLIDQEDELEVVTQTFANLSESDQITLRRLAMVTGIPLPILVGESVQGLNSTGDNERQIFQDTIETIQDEYLIDPINELMRKLGRGVVSFKENQGETPTVRIGYETTAIDNAHKLWQMAEDYRTYLEEKGVLQPDDFSKVFNPDPEPGAPPATISTEEGEEGSPEPDDTQAVDPSASLNGAQVTAILEIITRIETGAITKSTAMEVIATAFPLSKEEAATLLADVKEGVSSGEA